MPASGDAAQRIGATSGKALLDFGRAQAILAVRAQGLRDLDDPELAGIGQVHSLAMIELVLLRQWGTSHPCRSRPASLPGGVRPHWQ